MNRRKHQTTVTFLGVILLLMALATGCRKAATPRSWQLTELDSPTTASLRGLSVVSDSVAWASGSGGTVLRTVDGGATWTLIPMPHAEALDFRDVQAFNDQTALLMTAGAPARFYRTANGGATWQITYETTASGAFFDGMAFWDTRRGVAMSDPVDGHFLLLRTEDGGRSWQEIPTDQIATPLENEGGFAASGTSIAVAPGGLAAFGTSKARILRSEDWGHTWQAVNVPIRTGAPSQGVFSIAFWGDRGRGVLTGGDYAADSLRTATAAYTTDGGKSWLPAAVMPHGFCSAVTGHPLISAEWLAVGTTGCSHSCDGGITWTPVSTMGFHTVQNAPGSNIAYSTGSNGRLARWIFK